MEIQPLIDQIDKQSVEIESLKNLTNKILHVLGTMNDAMIDGFEQVNERLVRLEGKEGMQGVNKQLGDIKEELNKIQKAYPYEDLYNNMQKVQGEA
jgi:archaellum component FlaC